MSRASLVELFLPLLAYMIVGSQSSAAPGVGATSNKQAPTNDVLPLKHGYYVASDTPCAEASNATVALLQRDGVGGSRDFCEFRVVKKAGFTSYRVTQDCRDLQDGAHTETSTVIYTIFSDTRFTSKNENGWKSSARYCDQSAMGHEWHVNDIGDVID
jgi:hypothetical protein